MNYRFSRFEEGSSFQYSDEGEFEICTRWLDKLWNMRPGHPFNLVVSPQEAVNSYPIYGVEHEEESFYLLLDRHRIEITDLVFDELCEQFNDHDAWGVLLYVSVEGE